MLVLRQWVLEAAEDNTWLGLHLEGQQPLEEILDLLWTARCDERLLEQLVEVEYMWHVVVGGVVCPDPEFEVELGHAARGDDDALRSVVSLFGYLTSPAILSYLRACMAGDPAPPPPLRGLLVTTLIYGESLEDVGMEGRLGGSPFRWDYDEERRQASVLVMQRPTRGQLEAPLCFDGWFHDGNPSIDIRDTAMLVQYFSAKGQLALV